MAGGLHLAVDVVLSVGRILEPLRTEAAVRVLELREGEPLVVADKVVGAGVVAVERAGGPQPPLAGIREPEEPVRAAARGTPDRLFDLLRHEPFERPDLAVAGRPFGVGREIVRQTDEREGQFGAGEASEFLLLDEVGDGEPRPFDLNR